MSSQCGLTINLYAKANNTFAQCENKEIKNEEKRKNKMKKKNNNGNWLCGRSLAEALLGAITARNWAKKFDRECGVGGKQVLVNSEKENKTMTREQQIKTIDTNRSIDISAFIYRTIDRALKEIYQISYIHLCIY